MADASRVEFDEKKLDAIFASIDQCHLPGAAIGVAVGGRPVYRRGFGLASMELPIALSPSTRLRIGSTSKHFTCLAYMLLCEDGKAAVDDPVARYIPELNRAYGRVTMRQLMGSTSGLPDVYDLFYQFADHYVAPCGPAQFLSGTELLAEYGNLDHVNAPPNEMWVYNNAGWLLLTTAIERISGVRLEEFLHERVFLPTGMYDTLLLRSDTEFISNRGAQHVLRVDGSGFERMYWGLENFVGAGAIVSTADDLLRWLIHMERPVVGSRETWKEMTEPLRLANGMPTGYAFGFVLDHYRGLLTLMAPGNTLGGNAQIVKVPEAKLDIVVLVNRQDVEGWQLAWRVIDACVPGLESIRTSRVEKVATGVFQSATSGRVVILHGTNGTQLVSFGGLDMIGESEPDGRIGFGEGKKDKTRWLELVGDRLSPLGLVLNDFGHVDRLDRVESGSSRGLEDIDGKYRCAALQTETEIASDGSHMRASNRFGTTDFELEWLGGRLWRARPAKRSRVGFIGGILAFSPGGQGFCFSNTQTRSLKFDRRHD